MSNAFTKTNYVVKVKTLTAVSQYMEVPRVIGDWNLIIEGTWTGTLKVLRLFKDNINLGYHSGAANAATLTFTLKDAASQMGTAIVITNSLVGLWIRNDTDGSYGLITANDSTTITSTLAGGTENDWDKHDTFSLFYEAASYTAKADPQAQEPENDVGITIISTTYTTGPVLVRISQ
jgi:hypothetical protein